MDFWETLKADAEAVLGPLEAEAADVWETIKDNIVPVLEEELKAFATKYFGVAVNLVLEAAQGELAVLPGQEKQGHVVTHLIQKAEEDGHSFTSELRSMAITTAQNAYAIVQNKVAQ